ncbi:MAG: ABC transporter ATP-binding protein [Spirochaetales bacterium]|nr:ABC transporter ATP-binding protein [Spirochaetales bacterium]
MSDFFEKDEVTKVYDPALAARMVRYMKPYFGLVAASLLALAVSTGTELLMPVLVQRTVDEAIVVSYVRAARDMAASPELAALELTGEDPAIGEWIYLRERRLSGLSRTERDALVARGVLDIESRYLVSLAGPDTDRARVLAERAELFESEGDLAAIKLSELRELPPADARALRAKDSSRIKSNMFVYLALLAASLAATFAQTFASSLVGQKVMKDLRMELFGKTARQSLAFLSKHPVGRLVTRLTSDVETINQFFTDVLAAFAKDFSVMAGVLVTLVLLDWKLGLVTALTLPPVAVATSISRRMARDAFRKQRQWLSKVNAYIAEHLSGVAVVRLFAREKASVAEFEKHDRELLKASLGEMYVFATFRPLVEFFASTSIAVILWYGSSLHASHAISLGTLIAFVNLIRMFYNPVTDISEKYTLLQSAMAGGERVFALLDADERIPDEGTRHLPRPFRGRIEFDHVWFAYKEGEWVLKDLSFTVEPGEMVAIVGYTGAGKTTIAMLLSRMWDVQKGEIRIDGVPIRDIPLDELRRAVQPVAQDVFLFSGSIADNIRLHGELAAAEVEKAARVVHAAPFIGKLPKGYDTDLSEGATNISTGQRQLVSFARVVAHDPSIVVLDEATSSVDTETEKLLQKGLSELLSGRTSVVIAHRLSTIRHAHRILVLASGRLVEEGRHDALVARGGVYYNLYRLQYGREIVDDNGGRPAGAEGASA